MKNPKSTSAERKAAITRCRKRMAKYTPAQRKELDEKLNTFLGLK